MEGGAVRVDVHSEFQAQGTQFVSNIATSLFQDSGNDSSNCLPGTSHSFAYVMKVDPY